MTGRSSLKEGSSVTGLLLIGLPQGANTRSIRAQKWYHGITEGESVDAIESQGPGRRTHPTFGRGFALEGESND